MKSVIVSLVAVAGLSVAASAEVNTNVSFTFLADGVATSAPVFTEGTGSHTVEVIVQMSYVGTGNALGFASAVFQPTVSNFLGSDAALGYVNNGLGSNVSVPSGVVSNDSGSYGRISPYGRTALSSTNQALFNHTNSVGAPAGSWLRVAQRSATAWVGGTNNTTGGQGVPVAQLANVGRTASDPAFNPSITNVAVFRFGMTINTDVGGVRDLVVSAPLDGFGNRNAAGEREVYWWGDLNASTGDLRGTASVTNGLISIIPVPTPATMALLGLGGLCVARRRR